MSDAADTTTAALLTALLSPERSVPERLTSLRELRPFFHDEAVLNTLAQLLEIDPSYEVRRAILAEIADAEHIAFLNSETCRAALLHAAAFETEAPLRRLAVAGLLRYAGNDPRTETLLAALLPDEFDPATQLLIAEGLARLPRTADATVDALAAYAAQAPANLQHALAIILGRIATPAARNGLAALLHPATASDVKSLVLAYLTKASALEPAAAATLANYLAAEHDPALWSQTFFLLLQFQTVPNDTLSKAVEILLDRSAELAPVIPALRDRLHAQPALAARLVTAFDALPRATARLAIIETLSEADLPELTARAIADTNAAVRYAGLRVATATLNRHPQTLIPVLLRVYAAEPLAHHRAMILDALKTRPTLEPAHQAAILARLPSETDPLLRARLAPIVLATPPSPQNEAALLAAWTSLLDDPTLPAATRSEVIERLHAFAFSDTPAFADTLVHLLERTQTIEELARIFPLLKKVTRDPRPLQPALLNALYRFIDDYPRQPLDEIVNTLFTDTTTTSPELQSQIPYVVALTGAVHLLKSADTDTRKNAVYAEIHAAMLAGDTGKARQVLDTSFRDGVLKKSTVVQLFQESLAHPSFDDVFRPLMEIMEKSKLMTPEIFMAALKFIETYPTSSDTYNLIGYLAKHAPATIEKYEDIARGEAMQDNLTRYTLSAEEPRDDTGCSGTGWGDTARRLPWHNRWYMPELLSEKTQRPEWMRLLLFNPPDVNVPWFNSVHLHALRTLEKIRDFTEQDFQAVCMFLRQCQTVSANIELDALTPGKPPVAPITITPNLRPLAEFAAYLATLKWPALQGNYSRNRTTDLSPATYCMATDLYNYQFTNWLAQGGLAHWDRVAPLKGMNLEYLALLWTTTPDRIEQFVQSYAPLLDPATNPLPAGAPQPQCTYTYTGPQKPPRGTYAMSRFAALEKPQQLLEFVVTVWPPAAPPDSADGGKLREGWKRILQAAFVSGGANFEAYIQKLQPQFRDIFLAAAGR